MISLIMPICNVNKELVELTEKALASLGGWDEFILIDNASDFLGKYDPDIWVINKKNLGYPASINQAIKLAKGELLAIANNDIRVSGNWPQIAREVLAEDPKIGSVHFRMVEYEDPFNLGNDTWITGKERWCTSSFFVMRKEAFIGYDENFGLGGYDDYDYWYRSRRVGWKTAYTNRAAYQHKHSSTQLALDQEARALRDKVNKEYYKSKHGEYPDIQFANMYSEQMKERWLPCP